MNRRVFVVIQVLTLSLGLFASVGMGQQRGPSTAEERKRAVEVATLLENDPLNKDAKALSKELLLWLIQVPDISVSMCLAVLGDSIENQR